MAQPAKKLEGQGLFPGLLKALCLSQFDRSHSFGLNDPWIPGSILRSESARASSDRYAASNMVFRPAKASPVVTTTASTSNLPVKWQ